MGGHLSGTAQASRAENAVLEAQLDALALMQRAFEASERQSQVIQEALGLLRRANGRYVRLVYTRDSLQDLETA